MALHDTGHLRDAALRYAEAGWQVFPVKPRAKTPATEHGFKDATTDPTTIGEWWSRWRDANIGVATGAASRIVVVDVDELEGLAKLEAEHGPLPATLTAETGSGGRHLVYRHPGVAIPNRARFAEGLDVRGDGGYIVVAPSVHPSGNVYRWLAEGSPQDAPDWLLELLTRPRQVERSAFDDERFGESKWGRKVLEGEVTQVVAAVEGTRNETLFRAACKVFGAVKGGHLPRGEAYDCLRNAALGAGLKPVETQRTLESAWDTANVREPEPRPDPPPSRHGEPLPPKPAPLLRVLSRDELDTIPPPEWLVEGIITTGFTVLYGPSGAGKSFLALDWACHVATGTAWLSKKCVQRRVLYVAAEGTAGIPKRVDAWEVDRHHRARDFALIPQVVNLLDVQQVKALEAEVQSRHAGLLAVDTLARSMPGGDENTAQDMGRLVDALTGIGQRNACAVLLIHHTGVEGKRPRGSTSLFGAADTVVRCEADGDNVLVACDKQKDDEPFYAWALRKKPTAGSIVLTLAGKRHTADTKGWVLGMLADRPPATYRELVQMAGGDGQAIAELVEDRTVESGPDGRYTLASSAVREIL